MRIVPRLFGTAVLTLTVCVGCTDQPKIDPGDPQMSAYIDLVLPDRIEVQRYLTKPVSLAGDGTADGLEVILAAYDAAGDPTKVVGTFHFELQTRRPGEHIGERVGFWPVDIRTAEAIRRFRDPLSRYYQFPLQLPERPLKPGQYALSVWLHLPGGKRLLDDYEFTYDGRGAPPARAL